MKITFQEYYISSTKGEIGKLNRRYYSLCRKYQAKGIVESRYTLKKKLTSNLTENNSSDSAEPTKLEIDACEWLKCNTTPEITVYEKWSETYNLRRNQINESNSNIFENWPLLKHGMGAFLIELDFNMLHPGKDCLAEKFVRFSYDILPYYSSTIKDDTSKKLLNELGNLKSIGKFFFQEEKVVF